MTTALSVLRQRLSESIGDFIEVVVTTAIGAGVTVISTNLKKYDGGADDYYKDWWVYITDKANAGVERQISSYITASGTLSVFGSDLTNDVANLATVWVCRHSIANKDKALNRAIEELYPDMHSRVDNLTLITGNHLPNAHFEDWAVSTAPDFYTMQDANITATAQTTHTAGSYRGGTKSMKATTGAAGAGKYVYITSKDYPRLLDLMGRTIDFKCWAYPEKANDASIEIYTLQADPTTPQTLTSTTACPVTAWTLLELNDQTLNDDLVEIQFRFKITTASKYVCFDDAVVCGRWLWEYLLPDELQNGIVNQVYIQTDGHSDYKCYDLVPRDWKQVDYRITHDGTYRYLQLQDLESDFFRMRLIGTKPFAALSSATVTIPIDQSGKTDLIIAYANYLLYEMVGQPVSSEDIARYENAKAARYNKYLNLLRRHRMISPPGTLHIR